MSHADLGPLASYNSLTDPNLAGYFTSVRLRRHLRRTGLVTKNGVVVSETVYRMNWAKREQKKKMHEILAQAILDKSLEVERMRQAEIRKKVEEISKIENVRRIKESRDHRKREDTLPLLSARHDLGSSTAQSQQTKDEDEAAVTDEHRRTQSAGPRPATSQYPRQTRSAHSPYRHIPPDVQGLVPSPPRQRQSTARSSARYRQIKSAKARSRSPADETSTPRLQQPVANVCTVKMHYFGPNLKIDEDFDGRGDLITVEQQPAGCGTLIVFRDYVQRGIDFKFVSRRYRTHPFSLTIYVNSQQDCRLSTCCEYKHKAGARLGGQQGHFGVVRVTGDGPCFRCQFDEQERRKEKEKTEQKQSRKKSKSATGEKKAQKASRNKSAQDEDRKADAGLTIAVDSVEGDGYDYEDDFENLNQDGQAPPKHSGSKSSTPRSSSSKSSTQSSGSKSSDSQSSSSKSSSARSQDNVASSQNNDSAPSAVVKQTDKPDDASSITSSSSSSRRSRKDDSRDSGNGNPDVKITITEVSTHSDDDNESSDVDRSGVAAGRNSGGDDKDSKNNATLVKSDDDSKNDDLVEERNDKPETVPSNRKSSVSSASITGSGDRSASDSDGSGSDGRKKRRKKKSNENKSTVDARHAEGAGVSDDNADGQQKSDVEKDRDEKNADDGEHSAGETASLFDTSYESDKPDEKSSKEMKTEAGGADEPANDVNADGEVQLKVFTDDDQLTDQDNQIKEETFRVFANHTPVGDNSKTVEASNVDNEKVDESIKPAETSHNNARRLSSDSSSGSSYSESDSESGSGSSSDTGSGSSSSSSDEDSKAGDRNLGRNAQLM